MIHGLSMIPMKNGKMILIDSEDLEMVAPHSWCQTGRGYVQTTIDKRSTYLARFLLNAPHGMDVDHINHNALDNRRSNLRLCTHQENSCNSLPCQKWHAKGIAWCEENKNWRASIHRKGRCLDLGRFKTEQEASDAYDKAARELFGEFACVNNTGGLT